VTDPILTAPVLPAKRSGAGHWLGGFGAMLRWEMTGLRLLLPITMIIQFLSGAGFVLGIGLLFEEVPARTATFLSTGAAVVTLIVVGLVLGPQLIAGQKQAGTYDFTWSLPVPRSAATAAWTALNLMLALPGFAAALLVGVWRFDIEYELGWDLVPAVLATLVTATLVGYAFAHAIPNPDITIIISQLLIFVVIGFAPINIPPENLPAWLAELHEYLPFTHMARVVRHALVPGLVLDVTRSYLVLGAWTVAAGGVAGVILRRRR
jgi:ABC-2 type transport system permease protein